MNAIFHDESRTINLDGLLLGPFKQTAYNTSIKPLVGGLVAQGKSVSDIRAFLALMPDTLDADGAKALEVGKLIEGANGKLTPAFAEEAKGLLGTLDVLNDEWEADKASYDAAVSKWTETEDGACLAALEEAVRVAIAAKDAHKTASQASAGWKALTALETGMTIKSGKCEEAKSAVTALRRKIVGEAPEFDALTLDIENGKVSFVPSGKRKARKTVVRTPGEANGKGQSLTVDGVSYPSAAAALVACNPAFVSEHGKNLSRPAIVANLTKAGHTCA